MTYILAYTLKGTDEPERYEDYWKFFSEVNFEDPLKAAEDEYNRLKETDGGEYRSTLFNIVLAQVIKPQL